MENVLQLASDIMPSVLSILACIIAFIKGNSKVKLTTEEIEAKAEAKKQKLITKLNKKNKIKPSEPLSLDDEVNKELVSLHSQFAKEEFLRHSKEKNNSETNKNDTITMLGGY